MCTVSIISWGRSGYRLVHNRDEQRRRSAGRPPEARRASAAGVCVTMPTDPDSGGTWIGTSELGTTLCVLNVNTPAGAGRPAPVRSRGVLIPELFENDPGLSPGELGGAVLRVVGGEARLSGLAPFRVLAVGRGEGGPAVASARWDGLRFESGVVSGGAAGLCRPVCFVSSGLGDELVEPRVALFERLVGACPTGAVQDAFHRHRWADRPAISVMMSRERARTVAITTVEAGDGARPSMAYEPVPEAVSDGASGGGSAGCGSLGGARAATVRDHA